MDSTSGPYESESLARENAKLIDALLEVLRVHPLFAELIIPERKRPRGTLTIGETNETLKSVYAETLSKWMKEKDE